MICMNVVQYSKLIINTIVLGFFASTQILLHQKKKKNSLFSSYFIGNHQHLSAWHSPGNSKGHFLVQTTIANHECSALCIAFLKPLLGTQIKPCPPLPMPLRQFRGKMRLRSHRGPGGRGKRKGRQRRRRARRTAASPCRLHKWHKTSISDNQTLSPVTHTAARGHLIELLLDLEHFVIATHGYQRSLERGEDFSQKKEGSAA